MEVEQEREEEEADANLNRIFYAGMDCQAGFLSQLACFSSQLN